MQGRITCRIRLTRPCLGCPFKQEDPEAVVEEVRPPARLMAEEMPESVTHRAHGRGAKPRLQPVQVNGTTEPRCEAEHFDRRVIVLDLAPSVVVPGPDVSCVGWGSI